MDENHISDLIDKIISDNPIPNDDGRGNAEAINFKKSILVNAKQLGKTPSTFQIESSWTRWKRERNLQEGLETHINTKILYGAKNALDQKKS